MPFSCGIACSFGPGAERRRRPAVPARSRPDAESGHPGYDPTSWDGLFAPAGTPAPVIARLDPAMRAAIEDHAVRRRLAAAGNEPALEGSKVFVDRIRRERETVRQIVQEIGLKPE